MRNTLDTDFFAPARPRVFAHRGCSGEYPENTIEAFQAAVKADAPYIELDVHMTRDGEVVVCHDANLKRTCGRDALVAELAYADLATADAGYSFTLDGRTHPFRGKGVHVPKLEEVLRRFADRMFVIEIKQVEPSLVARMLDAIERARMRRRVLIAGEHHRALEEVRALAPAIPTSFSGREVAGLFQAIAAHDGSYRAPADALEVPPEYESWKLVTPEIVAAAHRAGAEVHVWTVNDPDQMRQMLSMGVDGIITDFPARLIRLLSETAR